MLTYPSMHDVGIDAMLQGYGSNGRARLCACLDNMQLELWAIEPALGRLAGASLARHGVRDVHRAHYLSLFALLQDGTPSRLPLGWHGGVKKSGAQAIGKSRGGRNTKIHLVAATKRTALKFSLSPGQAHDGPQGRALLKQLGAY